MRILRERRYQELLAQRCCHEPDVERAARQEAMRKAAYQDGHAVGLESQLRTDRQKFLADLRAKFLKTPTQALADVLVKTQEKEAAPVSHGTYFGGSGAITGRPYQQFYDLSGLGQVGAAFSPPFA